jgi:NTE family protein
MKFCIAVVLVLLGTLSTFADESLRVGIVLSGGGARGMAHIGVLQEFEKEGIPIAAVSGTSMGAVIGGLFASGYSGEQLEKIVTDTDWQTIFNDQLSRSELTIEDKERNYRYIRTFPLQNGKIQLPSGLIVGQKLMAKLAYLSWPSIGTKDFSDLPVPFVCVATDLETGEAVTLQSGQLHEALRASMSIPSVFVPQELDGRLLVDGMVSRNLPAADIQIYHPDIVIGVDVSAPLYEKKELNQIFRIIDQSISFRSKESTENQKKLCNVVISPSLDQFAAFDFEEAPRLIEEGRIAARRMMPKIKSLLKNKIKFAKKTVIEPVYKQKVRVNQLRVEGLKRVSKEMVLNELNLVIPGEVNADILEEAVYKVYRTGFFDMVTFSMEPASDNSFSMVLKVVERSKDTIGFSLHYDTDAHASVLINTTLTNFALKTTKSFIDVILSDEPEINAQHFVYSGIRRNQGLYLNAHASDQEPYIYNNNGSRLGQIDYSNIYLEALFASKLSHDVFAAIGYRIEHASTEAKVQSPLIVNEKNTHNSLVGRIILDTLDRTYYPNRGYRFELESLNIFQNHGEKKEFSRNYMVATAYQPLSHGFTLNYGFKMGLLEGYTRPVTHIFYLGGDEPFYKDSGFRGLGRGELGGSYMQVKTVGLHKQLTGGRVIGIQYFVGAAVDNRRLLFNSDYQTESTALYYTVFTPVGPATVSAIHGDRENFKLLLSLGHRF